ncbi:MAG TPA: hypothetical protein VK673_21865 [Chthoniobacterales bacterium]|nr:hypothetical protein [Chthoniobacterales bacterium]
MNQATMLWWCLWEKECQLSSRCAQFEHTAWPVEAKNAAIWERNQLKTIREKLENLEREQNVNPGGQT